MRGSKLYDIGNITFVFLFIPTEKNEKNPLLRFHNFLKEETNTEKLITADESHPISIVFTTFCNLMPGEYNSQYSVTD